jgi:phenylalanyl-tRNA synthetase beta subunit
MAFSTVKVKEISNFQASNFDISFEITPNIKGSKVKNTIEKTDPKLIQKVELIDIYNDKEKL